MSFSPTLHLIEDVTNSAQAEVTTVDDHGYLTGYVVRVIVPAQYEMKLYEQTTIVVTGDRTFMTQINTLNEPDFVSPTFSANGYGYTPAQVVVMSGTEKNIL